MANAYNEISFLFNKLGGFWREVSSEELIDSLAAILTDSWLCLPGFEIVPEAPRNIKISEAKIPVDILAVCVSAEIPNCGVTVYKLFSEKN